MRERLTSLFYANLQSNTPIFWKMKKQSPIWGLFLFGKSEWVNSCRKFELFAGRERVGLTVDFNGRQIGRCQMTKTQIERSKFDRAVIPGTARNAITVCCDQFDAVQIVTDQVIRVIPGRAHVHRAAIDGFECYSAIRQRNLQIDLQRLAKCFTLQR